MRVLMANLSVVERSPPPPDIGASAIATLGRAPFLSGFSSSGLPRKSHRDGTFGTLSARPAPTTALEESISPARADVVERRRAFLRTRVADEAAALRDAVTFLLQENRTARAIRQTGGLPYLLGLAKTEIDERDLVRSYIVALAAQPHGKSSRKQFGYNV